MVTRPARSSAGDRPQRSAGAADDRRQLGRGALVVTEFGIVNLKGKSIPERATAMISLAHPEFRDDLERDARAAGLLGRAFW